MVEVQRCLRIWHCTLGTIANRQEVYQGLETTQIIAKVANESSRPPVPQDCPWKDLMIKCWEEKPTDRLEFNEIVAELNKTSKELVTQRKMREAVIASEEARLIEANASATAIDGQATLSTSRVASVSCQMRYCLANQQSLTMSRCETRRQFS